MSYFILRFLFLFLPIFVIGLVIFGLALNYRFDRWMRLYRQLGRRYSGNVDSYCLKPLMRFVYGNRPCSLSSYSIWRRRGKKATVLQTQFATDDFGLQIVTRDLLSKFKPSRRWQAITLSDEAFGHGFRVHASDELQARQILTDSLRWHLREMKARFDGRELWVRLERKRLSVAVTGYLKKEVELNDFLRLALRVVDQVLLVEATGIDFVSEGEAISMEAVKCPVCSGDLGQSVVVCVSCKTPHCRECWEYNGRCAMFACNETRFHQV